MTGLAHPELVGVVALGLGGVLGVGLWTVAAAIVPTSKRDGSVRIGDPAVRIASALRDVSSQARSRLHPLADDPVTVMGVVVAPGLVAFSRLVDRALGGSAHAERTLALAGARYSVSEYRVRRVIWASVGAVGAVASVAVVASLGVADGVTGVWWMGVSALVGSVVGAGLFDRRLRQAALVRQARLSEEFPAVLELLALALAAGESLPGAMSRIAQRGSGELALEWRQVMRRVDLGAPLGQSLRESAEGLGVAEIHALIEHVVVALERGAPLAEVVRSHSADARNDRVRAIIDRAGKAEVWMLVPLVLLILPTTVIFAVWPSLQALQVNF